MVRVLDVSISFSKSILAFVEVSGEGPQTQHYMRMMEIDKGGDSLRHCWWKRFCPHHDIFMLWHRLFKGRASRLNHVQDFAKTRSDDGISLLYSMFDW